MYHRREVGELDIIVTKDDIASAVSKYPKTHNGLYEHRPYIADRFAVEHGVVITNFAKLKYLQSKCQTAILVRGKLGVSLSARLDK
jgi:hypothetical protein